MKLTTMLLVLAVLAGCGQRTRDSREQDVPEAEAIAQRGPFPIRRTPIDRYGVVCYTYQEVMSCLKVQP